MQKLEFTMYRPEETNLAEYDRIIAKFKEDLQLIISEEASQIDVLKYAVGLISFAEADDACTADCFFWALERPDKVCREGYMYYVAEPTRIAMAILVNVERHYSEVAELVPDFKESLRKAMNGVGICGFMGHGYDGDRYLVDVVEELVDWGVLDYIKDTEEMDFREKFRKARNSVRSISHAEGSNWFVDENLKERAAALCERFKPARRDCRCREGANARC